MENYNIKLANRLKKSNLNMIRHLNQEDIFPIKTGVELKGGVRTLLNPLPGYSPNIDSSYLATGMMPNYKLSDVYFNDQKKYGSGFFDDLVNVGHNAGNIYEGALTSHLLGLGRKRRGRPRKSELDGSGFWDDLKGVGSRVGSTLINKVGDVAVKKGEKYLEDKLSGKGRRRGRPKKSTKQYEYEGSGFWDDLKGVGSRVGSTIANKLGDAAVRKGEAYLENKLSGKGRKPKYMEGGLINPFDVGFDFGKNVLGPAIFGRGRNKPVRGQSGSKSQRGAMVSKLMKSKGMTLGEASKYIKEKGLM